MLTLQNEIVIKKFKDAKSIFPLNILLFGLFLAIIPKLDYKRIVAIAIAIFEFAFFIIKMDSTSSKTPITPRLWHLNN
jgi:hypothetical protein